MTKAEFIEELNKINYTQTKFFGEIERGRITDRLKENEHIPTIYVKILELITSNIKKDKQIKKLLKMLNKNILEVENSITELEQRF